jgi:uncharacterized membrane protein YtjA (UPF0391 family)
VEPVQDGRVAKDASANRDGAWRQSGAAEMLGWAITFFVIAIIAAVLGFGGIAGSAVYIAQILFVIFLILFLISLVWHLVSGRGGPPAL